MPRGALPRAWLAVAALALSSCAPGAAPSRSATPFRAALEGCRLEGLGRPALCGTLEVPEDRDEPAGRRIGLHVVVVPARASRAAPDPIFLLAGGPGQAITRVGGGIVGLLDELRRDRDFVLVDQRGTGDSHALRCEGEERLDAAAALRPELVMEEEVEACLGALEADPREYVTEAFVTDLDEVRNALGYETINLWGGSYGTRAALAYMRRHSDRVRSAVLDGVAPPTMAIPLFAARDAERALDRVFESCAGEAKCAEAYPELEAELRGLLVSLDERPAEARVSHPRTGEILELTITRDLFASGVRGLLYSPDVSSLLPLLVRRAREADYSTFVTAVLAFAESAEEAITPGLMLSVLCAEDLPRVGPERAETEHADTFLGDAMLRPFREACALWPHGAPAPDAAEPVSSDVPTLLLSGELDPITPPAWGEEAAAHLARSRHVVVTGAGHGVTAVSCVPDLIADFVKSGDATSLDTTCLEGWERPPFFLDYAGPAP